MNPATSTPTPIPTPRDADAVRRARRGASRQLGFLIHALVFTIVNLAFLASGLWSGRPMPSMFPFGGWALALAIHGLVTCVPIGRLHEALVARALRRDDAGR